MIQYHPGSKDDDLAIHYHTDEEKKDSKAAERSYTVRFQVQSPPSAWDMVVSKDVNANRIQFDYPATIKPETLLSFKINLGIGEKPIECAGRVLRCDPVHGSNRLFHVVSEFFEMGATELHRLNAGTHRPAEEEKPASEIPL